MAHPKWDRQDFYPYFRDIADRLALKDWTVIVSEEPPSSGDAVASAYLWYGRRRVRIHLSEDFLKASESDQRQTSVHELVHCHLDTLERLATREAETGDLIRPIRLALEYAVDGLADAIAPLMPLPSAVLGKPGLPKPTKKPRKRK